MNKTTENFDYSSIQKRNNRITELENEVSNLTHDYAIVSAQRNAAVAALRDAESAIETPADLSEQDRRYLLDDIRIAIAAADSTS